MAENKRLVSPGVFTSEKTLNFVTQQISVSTLGLSGETLRGPAFQPIFVSSYSEFRSFFGGLNPVTFSNKKPKYELPYIAKSYLSLANQLFVTRVLGLTGYDAGSAWAIVTNANYNPQTISANTATTTTWTADFSGGTYFNITDPNVEFLYELGVIPFGGSLTSTDLPGFIGGYPEGIVFTKVGNSFTGVSATVDLVSLTGLTGSVSGTVTTHTALPYYEYENKIIVMLRSGGSYLIDELLFSVDQSINGITSNMAETETNPLATFTLSANTSGLTNTTTYDVSLDPTNRNYISRVLSNRANNTKSSIWIEEIYPNYFKKLIDNNYILGLNPQIVYLDNFNNYKQGWQTPETPWIVSELRGNKVDKLFKFISVSDGNSANAEIKISIQNINPLLRTFDVNVRSFNDNDDNPVFLERFTNCTMNVLDRNYVAKKIGTTDGDFPLRSKLISIVINPNASEDSFPAGFEGYIVRDYDGVVSAPEMNYKTSYDDSETIRKSYLGISNKVGVDQNMFNWKGYTPNPNGSMWTATTKGFHMDVDAEIAGNFEVGCCSFKTADDIIGTIYENPQSRKFTLAPYLGFDGWNIYRTSRTNTDRYKINRIGFNNGVDNGEFTQISQTEGTSDYYAYLAGIRTFANPEETNINIFTTPGIDYVDNRDLVNETIDMIEEERSDSIYIVTSPDTTTSSLDLDGLGFNSSNRLQPEDIVDLLESADLDSNYTATYWPWIRNNDTENNVSIFLPPTYEVVRNIALTDNISFPWFATAGYTRGKTNSNDVRIKLDSKQRDILYNGRINPIAWFRDEGVVIWGNKNLQIEDTPLNRLNIRRLLLQIRKLISAVASRLLFEQNDQSVRSQFNKLVGPILSNIKREKGLSDFRIQLSNDPEEIDRNELRGKIFIKPVPSLEFIILEFNVTPTGTSFDDI